MNRRYFLKSGGLALAGVGLVGGAPSFLRRVVEAQGVSAAASGGRKTLITIFQRGAVDGLNMVVPHGERAYYELRPQIAIAQPGRGGAAESAVDLDGFFGLHPTMRPLKRFWDEKRLAIVHAVGSPDNTRSHFDAQDYMEAATPGNKSTSDGWLNRYMLANKNQNASPFRAVSLTANLPRTLMGNAPAIAMTNIGDFGVRAGQGNNQVAKGFEELYAQGSTDMLHGTGKEAFEAV